MIDICAVNGCENEAKHSIAEIQYGQMKPSLAHESITAETHFVPELEIPLAKICDECLEKTRQLIQLRLVCYRIGTHEESGSVNAKICKI